MDTFESRNRTENKTKQNKTQSGRDQFKLKFGKKILIMIDWSIYILISIFIYTVNKLIFIER